MKKLFLFLMMFLTASSTAFALEEADYCTKGINVHGKTGRTVYNELCKRFVRDEAGDFITTFARKNVSLCTANEKEDEDLPCQGLGYIYIPAQNPKSILNEYKYFKKVLVEKYGNPGCNKEYFHFPYSAYDSDEDLAVAFANGDYTIYAGWFSPSAKHAIALQIATQNDVVKIVIAFGDLENRELFYKLKAKREQDLISQAVDDM